MYIKFYPKAPRRDQMGDLRLDERYYTAIKERTYENMDMI
jgi:hypothetical protein